MVRFMTCQSYVHACALHLSRASSVCTESAGMVSKTVMILSRGYEESMDADLQELFNFAVKKGVTLFDTADSYGESFAQVFCSSTWLVIVLRRLTINLLASIRPADIKMYMTEQI